MIKFSEVTKKFNNGTVAVCDVSLEIPKASFVFLVGPTGAGKTTLLRLVTREALPSKGSVFVNDWDLVKLDSKKISNLRRKVGVVFQDLKLLVDRTLFENVSLPLEIMGVNQKEIADRVSEVIEMLELTSRRDLFPTQLSGGEMQRTAIARALTTEPEILLADEPTGNLDPATSWEIISFLDRINKGGTTVVMATHNADIVNSLKKRVVFMDCGRVVKDEEGAAYGTA